MKLISVFNIFIGVLGDIMPTNPQMVGLPGSQRDDNGCVLDGGYEWCEHSQSCERPWITPCIVDKVEAQYCQSSNIQTCRMMCSDPVCPEGQCALRVANCCDYICTDVSNDNLNDCSAPCPPQQPCPMIAFNERCRNIKPIKDINHLIEQKLSFKVLKIDKE